MIDFNNVKGLKIFSTKCFASLKMKEISVGISPCPNDTFVFGALALGLIDTGGYVFNFSLEDVETLNELSQKGAFDVVKISVANYALIREEYALLSSGAALGRGVGPIVVAKRDLSFDELSRLDVAVPGRFTTASFLFKYFFKPYGNLVELRYDKIIEAVLNKEVDAGVLIHETRFVYKTYGLVKVADLGEMWEQKTSMPIPLGVIAAKKVLGDEFIRFFEQKIKESIDFAYANKDLVWGFIKKNAQEMEDKVIENHIKTFVNSYTYDLKDEGKRAILKLLEEV